MSKLTKLPLAAWLAQLWCWLMEAVCQMTNVAKHSSVCSGLCVSWMWLYVCGKQVPSAFLASYRRWMGCWMLFVPQGFWFKCHPRWLIIKYCYHLIRALSLISISQWKRSLWFPPILRRQISTTWQQISPAKLVCCCGKPQMRYPGWNGLLVKGLTVIPELVSIDALFVVEDLTFNFLLISCRIGSL